MRIICIHPTFVKPVPQNSVTWKGPHKREASRPAYDLRFRATFGCPGVNWENMEEFEESGEDEDGSDSDLEW